MFKESDINSNAAMDERFQRLHDLFGDAFEHIRSLKILILGVGGVGGYALDALWRSGVSDMTIIDCDRFDPSNQNRQIGSEHIGQIKVDVMQKLYPSITPIDIKITQEWVEGFDFEPFDFVLDAIDDIPAKVAVAHHCHAKLISSTGSARKIDPTQIKIDNIWKTKGDKLAKKFRYELKKSGFVGSFETVYSEEKALTTESGSFVGVTGSFGLALASRCIQKAIHKTK